MYNDYINEKISEKREYDINLIIDYITIYIKSLILFTNEKESRIKLTNYIKEYLRYTKKEYELLKRIKELDYKDEFVDDIVNILDKLEEMFIYNYNIIENILIGYEDSFVYNDSLYSNFKEKEFNIKYLDNSIERIKGMWINENRKCWN